MLIFVINVSFFYVIGNPVNHVTFSHDNRWFVGYIKDSGAIQVWNMQSGDPTSRIVTVNETADLDKRGDDHQACIIMPKSSETVVFGAAKEVKVNVNFNQKMIPMLLHVFKSCLSAHLISL